MYALISVIYRFSVHSLSDAEHSDHRWAKKIMFDQEMGTDIHAL